MKFAPPGPIAPPPQKKSNFLAIPSWQCHCLKNLVKLGATKLPSGFKIFIKHLKGAQLFQGGFKKSLKIKNSRACFFVFF